MFIRSIAFLSYSSISQELSVSTEAEEFLGIKGEKEINMELKPEISLRKRMLTFVITWIVALIAAFPSPQGITILPFFPLGLILLFNFDILDGEAITNLTMITGWIVYLVLGIFILIASTKKRFYRLYAVLLVLLLLNVAGCHRIWNELSNIH